MPKQRPRSSTVQYCTVLYGNYHPSVQDDNFKTGMIKKDHLIKKLSSCFTEKPVHDRFFVIKDQGSRMEAEVGPGGWHVRTQRMKDQGPCFGTNEHHRRDTDVILRQSEVPLELFK